LILLCRQNGDVSLREQIAPPHPSGESSTVDSPPALRRSRRRWRDPRLWIGVVVMLACITLGARLFATADDTVAVWRVGHDVPAGGQVQLGDLRQTRVHFDDAGAAAPYLLVNGPLPTGLRAARDLRAGELLTSWSVQSGPQPLVRELPLAVNPSELPSDLKPGDHVQLWAVPAADRTGVGRQPRLVLPDVVVSEVGGDGFGATGQRQVLLALPVAADVATILAATSGSGIVLVRLAR
jgi:hypothetical protein